MVNFARFYMTAGLPVAWASAILGQPSGSTTPTGPSLQALSVTGTLMVGQAASGVVIVGTTANSTIAISGPGSAGLSVSGTGATRNITGTPTSAGTISVTETLAQAVNSPRSSLLTIVAPGPIALQGILSRGSTLTTSDSSVAQLQYRDTPDGTTWTNLGSPASSFVMDASHSGRELRAMVNGVPSAAVGPIAITDRYPGAAGYYGAGRLVLVVNKTGLPEQNGLVAGTDYETKLSFYRGQQPTGKVRISKLFPSNWPYKTWNYSAKVLGHHENTINPENPYTALPAGRVGSMSSTLSFAHISGPRAYNPLEEMFVWSQPIHTSSDQSYRDVCTGEIGTFYYVPSDTYNYFNGADCVQCGNWTDDKGRTFQMVVAPGPYTGQPFRIPYMVAIPAAGANVSNWDQGGQDKRGLINFWLERGWVNPSDYITGSSFGIEGLSDTTQTVADVVEFTWDILPENWTISAGGVRYVPDTADSFYMMQKTSRGTAMAYRFIRNSGDAAGSGSIGGSWQRYRPVLIAEFASFNADPKGAANTRLRTWMEDIGATDLAFARTAGGAFMGSFHGGETATSAPVLTMDGVAFDTTQAIAGDVFEMVQNTSITDGTATISVTNSKHRIVSGAAEFRFDPGTVNAGGTTFFRAYLGMGIASGAGWTEANFLRQAGGQKRMSIPNTIGVAKGSGITYVPQARDIAMRNPSTGMNWRVVTNAPSISGYRDTSIIREAPGGDGSSPNRPERAKIYFDHGGTTFNTKSGMLVTYRFEMGSVGATVFAANQVVDPTFVGSAPTNAGGAGPWFKSDNTGGSAMITNGVARLVRSNDGAGDERLWQPINTPVNSVWLFGIEEAVEPAGSPKPALAVGLNANGSVISPVAIADKTFNTGGGYLGHVFVATAAVSYLHTRLPTGTGVAQQIADMDNAVAMQIATTA